MKKFFISLGACAVAVAVGLGALLTTKENNNIAKADTSDTNLGNIELSNFIENVENLDIQVSAGTYWLNGDFITNSGYTTDNLRIIVYYTQAEDYRLSKILTGALNSPIVLYDKDMSGGFSSYWYDYKWDEPVRLLNGYVPTGNYSNTVTLINQLWLVLPLDVNGNTNTFTFDNQINYYAPLGGNIGQTFYNYVITGSNYLVSFYEGWFKSGGQLFNKIQLEYWQAQGTAYNSSGEAWGATNSVYFKSMYYLNTSNNTMLIVNERDWSTYKNGNSYGYYIMNSSTWRSQSYRNIELYGDVDDITSTKLDTLNNASNFASGFTNTTEVGLGSAFTLLGHAFSSVAGLLAIQVLPNITLGLLLFLPLIVGIIIAIIWIVKR